MNSQSSFSSLRTGALAGLLMLSATTVLAEEQAVDPNSVHAEAEAMLRTLTPPGVSIALSDSPVPGLLQAQVGGEILYLSEDGKYVLQGVLFDVANRTNLTDQAKAVVRKETIQGLDRSGAITFGPDKPLHDLLVFTDVDCGYCRKLHEQIQGYTDQGIAIHYLAFPRAGLGSHSFEKYVSAWCADDQKTAFTNAKAGEEPEPKECENPVQAQYELGQTIGVTGTPALLTLNGDLIPGYMPPEDLRARLDALEAPPAAAP